MWRLFWVKRDGAGARTRSEPWWLRTFADGQTVNGVARRHNISRSMLSQRAPVHSRSSCGALLRRCEAILNLCRFHVPDRVRLAFSGRYLAMTIKLSAAAFRPGPAFRLSRHRDPAPVGVLSLVPRWSHRFSIAVESMSYRKKAPSAFRPALVNNSGSISNDPLLPRRCQFFFATLSDDLSTAIRA